MLAIPYHEEANVAWQEIFVNSGYKGDW